MPKAQVIAGIILSAIITYLLTYIIHGSVHQALAYAYDLSDTPWINASDFHGWLQNIRENSEYANLDQQGQYFKIGIIGFGGYMANWTLLAFALLKLPKARGYMSSFFYWLAIWNLTVVFGYIPHHIFNSINITNTFGSVGVSVWMVYIIGGFMALAMIYILFYHRLPDMLDELDINQLRDRRIYFTISIVIVLFYSTLRFTFMLDDDLPMIMHIRFWMAISGFIFWFKLALLTVISFNIHLKPLSLHRQ